MIYDMWLWNHLLEYSTNWTGLVYEYDMNSMNPEGTIEQRSHSKSNKEMTRIEAVLIWHTFLDYIEGNIHISFEVTKLQNRSDQGACIWNLVDYQQPREQTMLTMSWNRLLLEQLFETFSSKLSWIINGL